MAIDVPFKILEIYVYSAQYLPPVSKMLRTFAVAWINPDHKLSTRIDHHGHTNPTWNYKLIFRVEDRFLRSERAALTVEIYNVAWLRDLPVGTAHLMINQISPPLVVNSSAIRTVSLNICRPSGHMQGILNIGINIVDNGNPKNSSILSPSELIALKIGKIEDKNSDNDNDNDDEDEDDYHKVEEIKTNSGGGKDEKQRSSTIDEKIKVLWEEFNKTKSAEPEKGSLLIPDNKNNSDLNLKLKIKSPAYSSVASTPASPIKPLPSEIAANLKKGFYATGHEYESSIFENWSEETTDHEKKLEFFRSRNIMSTNVRDQIHHHHHDQEINEKQINQKRKSRSGKNRGGGGLLSCFGKGFEFTLICGGGSKSNLRRKRKEHMHYSSAGTKSSYYPEDDFRRFYT